MQRVEPKVFVIAETKINDTELRQYLTEIGAEGWNSDAPSDIEELVEIMSRGCYKSFGTELNKNITRTRDGNKPHLKNIIAVNHGSVMEHAMISFQFVNVSRVFTHELVRHRVGTAISQESLRYVRLDNLRLWIPSCFAKNDKAVAIFEQAFSQAEINYNELLSTETLGFAIDAGTMDVKKELTSAARRVAPIGLGTDIGWSCNIRSLRHIIELRTSPFAEEEIRLVFKQVRDICVDRFPNIMLGIS